MRRRATGAVAALAALLIAAPSASALETVSIKGVDVGGGIFAGTAKCDPGDRVVSGGFSTSSSGIALVNEATSARGWTVKAAASSLTVSAYCSGRRTVIERQKKFHFDGAEKGTAKARCKRGQVAVAGGWRYSEVLYNNPIFKSRRAGRRAWSVTGFNDDDLDSLTAFVYCLKRGDIKVRTARSAPIPQDGDDRAVVECRQGEALLGGGFTTTPGSDFQNEDGPDLFYGTSEGDGGFWYAYAHNYGQPGRITVQAICVK